MSHFAQVDENNIVTQVVVAHDQEWCEQNLGGRWIQTSYNTVGGYHTKGGTPLRYNYAGIGYTYDETRDAFIPPKPYPSWVLDELRCIWKAPLPYPGPGWSWDENLKGWTK